MITAQQVNELRQRTKIGMMLCKKALEATNGNQDLAIEWLRKNGNSIFDNFSNESTDEYEVIWYENGKKIKTYKPDIYKSGEHFVYHPYYEDLINWTTTEGPEFAIDITIDENTKQFYSMGRYCWKIIKH